MSREPTYPKDAQVDSGAAFAGSGMDPNGEPLAQGDKSGDPKRTKHLMAGAAIGIGSAAIVAALLYANRNRKHEKGNG